MAELKLSNGEVTIVDEEDFYWLNQWRWHTFIDTRGIHYAFRSRRNNHLGFSSRAYLHRIVMRVENPNIFIDHINGNRLDNRKSNLRLCSALENSRNKPGKLNTSSKYKGVSWDKSRKKWQVQIRIGQGKRLMKRFDDEQEAVEWYNEQAKIYHGNFAFINTI